MADSICFLVTLSLLNLLYWHDLWRYCMHAMSCQTDIVADPPYFPIHAALASMLHTHCRSCAIRCASRQPLYHAPTISLFSCKRLTQVEFTGIVRVKQATLRTSAWQEVPRRARVHRIMSVQSQNLFCVYPFLVQASCNAVFAPKSFAARIHVPHGGGLVGTESTCGASLRTAPLYCQSRSPVVYAKQKAALVP